MSHYTVCTAGIPMVTLLGVTECLITSDSTDVSCQKYMRWRTEGLSSSLCDSSAWNTMTNIFPKSVPSVSVGQSIIQCYKHVSTANTAPSMMRQCQQFVGGQGQMIQCCQHSRTDDMCQQSVNADVKQSESRTVRLLAVVPTFQHCWNWALCWPWQYPNLQHYMDQRPWWNLQQYMDT